MADEGGMACQYQVLEELGSGSFGVVFKAIEKATGDIVAIKHIDLESSEDDIQEIQQEIAVLSTCDSPFVTQYKTSFLRGYKLWIVMEYLGGGSCLDLLKPGPFNEGHIAIVCRQLLRGLDYLHQEGKIHRDIKAANILLSQSGKVKLADFGVAAQLTNIKSQRNTFVGTPFWMAPEVIQQAGYDFKADIWSLGITAMELIHGEPPNANIHPMKVLFLIPKAPAPRLEGTQYSRDFRDFVASCLIKDPDRRPTAKELLQHRFIRSAGNTEALQELVERRQEWDGGGDRSTHPRYYEETMNTMVQTDQDDNWIFDTIKAATNVAPMHTPKRRKISTMTKDDYSGPEEMLQRLNLNKEHDEQSPPPPTTVRNPTTKRRISAVQTASRRTSSHKQPLAPDLNFGNGGSTIRQFRRVSDNSSNGSSGNSLVIRDENALPFGESVTKESLLGKRAFERVIDKAFQETYAQTRHQAKREALSRVADAWGALNNADPEGEYHLLRSILEKIQRDSKLSNLIPSSTPSTPQKPKLVLAKNNPHLKSHRRRQSSQPFRSDVGSEKQPDLPGRLVPGMEHTKHLADILYKRWAESLSNRWPAL